jgi:hypothetical protein
MDQLSDAHEPRYAALEPDGASSERGQRGTESFSACVDEIPRHRGNRRHIAVDELSKLPLSLR